MEFKIENTLVSGLDRCIVSSGNSYRTELRTEDDKNEKDDLRATKLGAVPVGSGHDSFLNGITVIADFTAPLYWWKQAQRYHWFEFVSSQSTMHCVCKFKLEERCVENVDPRIIEIVQGMIDKYNQETEIIKASAAIGSALTEEFGNRHFKLWDAIIASLPCGFCLSATMTTNYRQLKTMCQQRKNHKLKEWKTFIEWAVNELPRFSELTGVTLDE